MRWMLVLAAVLMGRVIALEPQAIATAATGELILHPHATNTVPVTVNNVTYHVPHGMVLIPPGPATIGTGRTATHQPFDAFFIGKFPVTEAEYKAFLDDTPSVRAPRHWFSRCFPAGRSNHPVPYVSLRDAERYCAWVSNRTGWKVGLPSAGQWEKAARGPGGTLYPWGNTTGIRYANGILETPLNYNGVLVHRFLNQDADTPVKYVSSGTAFDGRITTGRGIASFDAEGNPSYLSLSRDGSVQGWVNHKTRTGFIHTDVFHAINAAGGNTSPVGAYPRGVSGHGCFDMAGNLWNWTTTRIQARTGAESGKEVNEIRGGSWYAHARSAQAVGIGEGRQPAGAYNTVGFRIIVLP